MRIFGLLGLVLVLVITMYQYKNNLWGLTVPSDSGEPAIKISKSVEIQVNASVSDYQKKLEESMKQSGAQ